MKLKTFVNLHLKDHLIIATCIRFALIAYANYHDQNFDVPYTDVDYKVFSDAARHVYNGKSPYNRHTYRYSPVIAFLLIPNIFWADFGKVLFSIFDVLITVAIKTLVEQQIGPKEKARLISTYCALFWLYNPMSIAISTRGNADSVPCFFIILSLLFLQTEVVKGLEKYAISGALLGVSVHLRLYPLVFSFPMYLSLGKYLTHRATFTQLAYSLIPNLKQIILAFSCVFTLVLLTGGMFMLYGYEFLFETYIYHLFRKDTRHNFSILFYYSYLTLDLFTIDVMKMITQILEFIIIFMMSLTFGVDPKTLPFGMFCQTVVLVTYNSVVTSQYFVWFLSLLPLVIHSFKMVPAYGLVLTIMWVAPQGAWLFYAYLLEFKSRQVFIYIWLKSVIYYCANIYVLSQLIKSFTPGHGFGLLIADDKKNKK